MTRTAGLSVSALAGLALILGCRPALDDRPWLVSALRIVGWKAEPPEAAPGAVVSLRVIALDPAGPPDTSAAAWTLCRAPKPLAEDRVVASVCLGAGAPDAVGDPVQLAIPTDACRLFGPDPAQPAPGAPATRPRDPDDTGGYYQPLEIALLPALAVGLERVTCGLPDASLAAARAFQGAYHPNQNPALSGLTFSVDGLPVDATAVPGGARVTVQATWAPGAAETFPVFDRASGAVVETQETLVASWWVTAGQLDPPATAIADAGQVFAATTWTAPQGPATAEIAVILRDSRGGSDTARAVLTVVAGGL
jgi:hypothetical protein